MGGKEEEKERLEQVKTAKITDEWEESSSSIEDKRSQDF